ncbi:hypothetical protein [Chryseobacterium koreense]|uniref:Lipoprotein n=1 Tax=Chryseobacterium koreense CCUG 49689 TaxID=1304281 RepID=A0A0J7LNN1_9FLAO|nr:hypothetical protein [Chryseobacterium koreense]KMQ70680.1 hypothetical protein ACM44_10995 [Chryseobacterium koreense CCUG 49689]MBB5334529.1 hypothetical protein [Chryseobacterium koreense]
MKSHLWLLLPLFFSCSKKENTAAQKQTTAQNCFILKQGINVESEKKAAVIPTNEDILKKLPTHIQRNKLPDFKLFFYERKNTEILVENEKKYFESKSYKTKFSAWIKALPEFRYLSVNENFALAKNKYGLWIVENQGIDFKPYFLGFTPNFFLQDFYGKDQKFLMGQQVVFNGTLVNEQRLSEVPMLPKYEVIEDGLQFSIHLEDLRKDSDHDGFNDLFENFIGLNPNSADTDGDGINDFQDSNPKYRSATSKFTKMYEAIADEPSEKYNYSFTEILTNCEYFHSIDPKNRKILLYTTNERYPLMEDLLDHFFPRKYSKMQTYKDYPDAYFTDYADATGNGTISAEYIGGKWKIYKKSTVTFGM